MSTSEILEVVRVMQKDWEMAIDNSNEHELITVIHCQLGFCMWLYRVKGSAKMDVIIPELRKDFRQKTIRQHWYRTFLSAGKKALLPRLKHLNRTITRLENQLKTEQNGTL